MHPDLRKAGAEHPPQSITGLSISDGVAALPPDEEHDAVEQLMVGLMPDLVRYFFRWLNDSELAADCASNTVLIVWEKRKKLPVDESQQRAWGLWCGLTGAAESFRKSARRAYLDESLRTTLIHQFDAAETVVMRDDEGQHSLKTT